MVGIEWNKQKAKVIEIEIENEAVKIAIGTKKKSCWIITDQKTTLRREEIEIKEIEIKSQVRRIRVE